jgi:adenylate cyclase
VAATVLSAALGAAMASPNTRVEVHFSAAVGGLCGLVLAAGELLLRNPALGAARRLPVIVVLTLRLAFYAGVIAGAEMLVGRVFQALSLPTPPAEDFTRTGLVTTGIIALAVNVVFVLRAVLGAGVLPALVLGRYNRPRRQERIVLFLDLVGSTKLAEHLGDVGFLNFLNLVFYDLTEPVLDTGGQIYRYVGDEMIVSWPVRAGLRDAACIACVFAIDAKLAAREPDYRRRFGERPRVRAALHAGPLIVGEMGDIKREIVLLGDTMNTAARIEEACRTTGHDYIASGAVVRALDALPEGIAAIDLGVTMLRGKGGSLELFALQRGSSGTETTPPLSTPRARTVQPSPDGTGQAAEPSRRTALPE